MNHKKILYFRTAVIALLLVAMSGFFIWLVYDATVNRYIEPDKSQAVNTISTTKMVQAARGDITDRYGTVLVTNKPKYVITLNTTVMGDVDKQVEVVQTLIDICKEQGVEWNDEEFPVSESAPFEYTTDTPYLSRKDNGLYDPTKLFNLCNKMKESSEQAFWGDNSTSAAKLVQNMSEYFQLSESLSDTERREILGVLYSAYLRAKEIVYTDYYFAEDVDIHFITAVKEANLPGVSIDMHSVRDYKTSYAAHLLGQVGAISAEKWEELKDDPTYNMNDSIGLSGVEAAFEEYLKGVDGTLRTTYDSDGNVISETYTKVPQAGNNLAMTLYYGLQEVVEKSLAERTDTVSGSGGSAAVVLSAKDSSVLAMASYPTFDPATYTQDYEELAKDKHLPLFNRALLGTYAPGSTYKICTGTAAVSAGVTTLSREVLCNGTYNNFGTIQKCWRKSGHGYDNLSEAIRDSCNVYFYTMGTEMGIEHLTEVAQAYGLGVASGIELAESTGVNAGPEHAEAAGVVWYKGNVTSAAIGQSDNQFTILQLANYIAAFVRGGVRYDAHLMKNVKNSDNTEILYEHETQTLSTVELAEETRQAIVTGMGQVIEADDIEGFEDLEERGIKVASKTGTAQLGGSTAGTNGLFVAFAPIDDPEIVVCTVVEKAESGASTASITADIMNYYFSEEATLERVEAENQLLQ